MLAHVQPQMEDDAGRPEAALSLSEQSLIRAAWHRIA